MAAPGRREAHKQATRAALTDAARALFAERGFAGTTVRDIAAAANVTERTFFRYFASKEDLVYTEVLDLLPALHRAVVDQPAGVPPFLAIRDAIVGLSRGGPEPGLGLLFTEPPQFRPTSFRPTVNLMLTVEAGLSEALAERLVPAGVPRFHAEVLARAAVGALRSCLIAYHLAGGPAAVPLDTLRGSVSEAFELLDRGGVPA